MNLKDLLPKNLPFLSGSQEAEYFFALNISNRDLKASIWGVTGKYLKIINTVKVPVKGDDDLIEAGNRALDLCLGNFPVEPTKILFGVPDSWLQDDNLKETHANFLKHLTEELDVEPIAYVSTSHAVSHFLQKQTGVPTTAILVEIADPLNVTLVKGGKILGSRTVKRGNDLPIDIETALHSFTEVEVLPSKIVLYGSGDLNKLKEEITSFNWMSSLPFLHLPKIDILDENAPIEAISLAGASEIDPDVIFNPHRTVEMPRAGTPAHRMPVSEPEVRNRRGEFASRELSRVAPGEEGEILGSQPAPMRYQQRAGALAGGIEGTFHQRENQIAGLLGGWLNKPLAFLRARGINIKIPGGKYGQVGILAIIVLVVLLLGFMFLPHATIKIYVDPRVLERDEQVTADPNATTVDQAQKIIPGKIVETDIEGNQTGNATGTKQVGDPAKGEITIYNKSASARSFSQGTVFVGPNNLKFTLDSNVNNIASPSADTGTWGTATANVTASQIGPDSNLPAGTQLQVQGQAVSDFGAKVNSGLSGGTSKNVTVVTSDDQKKLLASLASSLRSQAQTKLQGKLSGDEKILSEALDENIVSTNYSKKAGDQASSFSLDLVIHYKGTAYSDNDLKSMVSQLVQTNVPPGFKLDLADTTTTADVSKLEPDGKLIFLARFQANLIPVLDETSIKNQIKGKTTAQAQDIIKGIDNVIGSNISIHPSLPGPLSVIPWLSQNINIDVTTK